MITAFRTIGWLVFLGSIIDMATGYTIAAIGELGLAIFAHQQAQWRLQNK